jgi:hypothetical protein
MIEHTIARHPPIGVSMRPGKSGAGGGQGLKAKALQIASGAYVPGIGYDEATGFVQSVKGLSFVGNAGASVRHEVLYWCLGNSPGSAVSACGDCLTTYTAPVKIIFLSLTLAATLRTGVTAMSSAAIALLR